MHFQVVGRVRGQGRSVAVDWRDGRLSGDALALRTIERLAVDLTGQPVGLEGGPISFVDHTSAPLSFLALCNRVFEADWVVRGEVPTVPDLPADAVH